MTDNTPDQGFTPNQMGEHVHVWKVAEQRREFVNVVDNFQALASQGKRHLDDIEVHGLTFTADAEFVQLACECGEYAAARNELPITGPMQ